MLRIGLIDIMFSVGFPSLTALVLALRHRDSRCDYWQRGTRSAAWCSATLAIVTLTYGIGYELVNPSTEPIEFITCIIVPIAVFLGTFMTGSLPAIFVTWLVTRNHDRYAQPNSPDERPEPECRNPYRSPRN